MKLLPIQKQIWEDKYRFISRGGIPRLLNSDTCIEDTWRRIAKALATPEAESRLWEKRFYSALEDFKFLPAGRIIAGAGTGRDVTLFNCFVLGTVSDSMEGIFQRLKDGALTMQQGGGIGMDFSTLRPNGADVHGVAAKASGPISFMDCWDSMCKTIMSAGARRGAMMGTLRCDHPDIEAFIDAKRDPLRLRNFNISVLVTNDFMRAVKNKEGWTLSFGGRVSKTIDAWKLWQKIMRSAYETAEPGVIFIDCINKTNNLAYCETISATNPCAEQPLPPNGACLLGSINLTAFIRHPFEPQVYWDEQAVIGVTKIAVRMLDNVIDVSNYPLRAQREEALAKRRIGLGITGLADTLAMCGLHYGSPEACATAAAWMKTINRAAYEASIALAEEKGKFPLFSEKMGNTYYPARTTEPMRNSHLTSIAPTGTISLIAGNVSSGIEPIYAHQFTRNIKQPDGSMLPVEVEDYAVRLYREKFPGMELPPQFQACAHDLSPRQHLNMQAALQPDVDSSISKTVNCPEDMPFEDFEQLYLEAYDMGLKACAAFRPNPITGNILEISSAASPAAEEKARLGLTSRVKASHGPSGHGQAGEDGGSEESTSLPPLPNRREILSLIDEASGVNHPRVIPRQRTMLGATHKFKWNGHAFYITINNNPDGSPYEVFFNSLNAEHYAWSTALTRMISAIFRRGGDISFVIEELKAIADPRGGVWHSGKYVSSVPAAIGYIIEEHIALNIPAEIVSGIVENTSGGTWAGAFCPHCGSTNVWFPKANCLTCRDCTFSNCD